MMKRLLLGIALGCAPAVGCNPSEPPRVVPSTPSSPSDPGPDEAPASTPKNIETH